VIKKKADAAFGPVGSMSLGCNWYQRSSIHTPARPARFRPPCFRVWTMNCIGRQY